VSIAVKNISLKMVIGQSQQAIKSCVTTAQTMIAFTKTRGMQMNAEEFRQALQKLDERVINFHKYEEKKRGGYVARWVGVSNKYKNEARKKQAGV
tara:strand:- start:2840 stop:3124 length:285 start_codon:yes stop_codon:yes gene_type:complete